MLISVLVFLGFFFWFDDLLGMIFWRDSYQMTTKINFNILATVHITCSQHTPFKKSIYM